MKLVVRLAIVFAVLLMVSNAALAQCTNQQRFCYSVTATDQNGSMTNDKWYVLLCNDEGYGFVHVYDNDFDGLGCLVLFGGGPGWFNPNGNPMFGGNPSWSVWLAFFEGEGGYLQPMGAGGPLLTGVIGRIGETKLSIKGTKIAMSNCPPVVFALQDCLPPES